MARGADPPWSSHAGMPKTDIRKYVRHGFTWSHFTPGESYKRPVLWIFWHYTDILDNIDSPVPGFWSVCSQNLTVAICWSSFWEVDSTDSQGSICLATFAVKGSAVTIKAVHQFIVWRNCLAFEVEKTDTSSHPTPPKYLNGYEIGYQSPFLFIREALTSAV